MHGKDEKLIWPRILGSKEATLVAFTNAIMWQVLL
jgi:hypothetical protein